MYIILNKNLEVCGTLNNDTATGCPFYADQRAVQIADDENGKAWDDTLTITVPYGYPQTAMMTEGYHLLKKGSDGKWYCFRITNWEDQPVGQTHVRIVTAYNLCEWNLIHCIVNPTTLANATCHDAFYYVLGFTDWTLDDSNASGPLHDESISQGATAQSVIQQFTTDYAVELRAYVELYNGKVVKKVLELNNQLGEVTGKRIEYGRNLTNITRTGADETLFTKIHVYGGTPSNADAPVSIAVVNGGRDYLVDDDANDLYNGGGEYLEGWIQNEAYLNPSGLKSWGQTQLAYYNHPKYTYTVDVAQLDWDPDLGDTVDIVDFSMEPELTIQARAIQKIESESDPTANKVVFGEFVELKNVTPDDIQRLSAQASAANRAAQEAKAPQFIIFTPDGTDFTNQAEQKRIITRAYQGKQEITYQLDPSQFSWQKIDADGKHDTDWETAHESDGNVILVDYTVVGSTIRCAFKNDSSTISRPAYFMSGSTGITSVANKVAALQGDNTLSIIFVTDSHYASGGFSNPTLTIRSIDHLRNVAALTHQIPIDLVVHGGDMTDGQAPKQQIIDDQIEAAGNLANNCDAPIFFINGNHDDASYYASKYAGNQYDLVLNPDDRYTILKPFIGPDFQLNEGYENRLYGLMDFTDQKIRVICLNDFENPYIKNADGTNKYKSQYTAGIMQDQLTWLVNVALQVPDDSWAVCLFMHQRYAVALNDDYKNINFDLLDGVIDAFHNGTTFSGSGTTADYNATVDVDFTGHPHDVIGVFHGHIHEDVQHNYGGINLIATLDCLARNDYPGSMPDRPYPSLQEDAWDVITIDRSERKIYLTRFGAGSDREYNY